MFEFFFIVIFALFCYGFQQNHEQQLRQLQNIADKLQELVDQNTHPEM